jgi:hypothetical protein
LLLWGQLYSSVFSLKSFCHIACLLHQFVIDTATDKNFNTIATAFFYISQLEELLIGMRHNPGVIDPSIPALIRNVYHFKNELLAISIAEF